MGTRNHATSTTVHFLHKHMRMLSVPHGLRTAPPGVQNAPGHLTPDCAENDSAVRRHLYAHSSSENDTRTYAPNTRTRSVCAALRLSEAPPNLLLLIMRRIGTTTLFLRRRRKVPTSERASPVDRARVGQKWSICYISQTHRVPCISS